MSINLDIAPPEIRAVNRWVVEKDKQPFDRVGNGVNWTEDPDKDKIFQFMSFNEAVELWQNNPEKYDCVGFITPRNPDPKEDNLIIIDLDNCVDPVTETPTPWASGICAQLKAWGCPLYLSYSKTGYRSVICGKLPNNENVGGRHGSQVVSDETKDRIFEAKPTARSHDFPFNRLEMFVKLKNVTFKWPLIAGYSENAPRVDSEEIKEFITLFTSPDSDTGTKKKRVKNRSSGSTGESWVEIASLPHLPLKTLIDITNDPRWRASGNDWYGPHPNGSSSGHNLRVNYVKNTWSYWHEYNGAFTPGGDGWNWLACEMGLIDWMESGSGALKDADMIKALKIEAARRGCFTRSELGLPPSPEEAAEMLKDLDKLFKDDPGEPFKEKNILALAVLKSQDRPEFERIYDKLKKAHAPIRDLNSLIDKQVAELQQEPAESDETQFPAEIVAKAETALNSDKFPDFWVEVFHRRHQDDWHISISMLAANLTANIKNAHGIAVIEVNGESGDGKSHAVETTAEQMGRWCDISGLSPMALLYHAGKTIFEGTMVVLDDNRPDDKQADIKKRNQTKFKTGYSYKTVDAQRKPVTAMIPPGVQILSTQVDSKDEEEVINRSLMLEAVGSLDKDLSIIGIDLKRAETAEQPAEDPDIIVCQCALDILKSKKFSVVIPDAQKRIQWNERGKNGRANVRNFNIFIDLVFAFAVMRYRVRDHEVNPDGSIDVIATRGDFDSALKLYKQIHKQMAVKLTSKERELLEHIEKAPNKRLCRVDALKELKISDGRLSQLVNGKDGRGGLKGKLPGFYVETTIEQIDYVSSRGFPLTRTIRQKYLCLPEKFECAAIGVEPVIWIEDGVKPVTIANDWTDKRGVKP